MTDDARAPELRRGPFVATAVASVVSVVFLLPIWVLAAFVTAVIGLWRAQRSARGADAWVSIALGCSVGPIVYLLLAAVVAIA